MRASNEVFSGCRKKVASSAYNVTFVSIPFDLKPVIHELFLILIARISMHNRNRYGDS